MTSTTAPARSLLGPALGALALLHLALGAAWLGADSLLLDGDEAGHVGAAELLAAMWREGRGGEALLTTLAGRMGVYPPLYAGLVGAWWASLGSGDPTRVVVQGVNLLWPLLAALAVARLARPLGARAAWAAALAVLCTPLLCGLGRHFMLEGAVAAAVAWAVVAVERARGRPTGGNLTLVGLAVGLAWLFKQTALLYLLPVLALRLPRKPVSAVALAVAALVAAPWTLLNLGQQLGYGGESAAGTPGLGLLAHAAFYPWSLLWVGLGPPLVALGLAGVVAGLRRAEPRQRHLLWLALAWLLGSLLLLALVPRKYPRLMAPALPAIGLLVALAVARWQRGWRAGLLAAGVVLALAWAALGSTRGVPQPASALVIDDRCPQVWQRPPVGDDLGLGRAIEAVRATRPGPVRVVGSVGIPCALQTTHDWPEHLGPALRWRGADRNILRDDEPGDAVLVLSWDGPVEGYEGEAVPVEALEGELWIGRPSASGGGSTATERQAAP